MSHSHHGAQGQHHHHGASDDLHGRRLFFAVAINVVLTFAQLIGGMLSGSLALIADAFHNLSDAGALLIALVARRIAHLPATDRMTFGYRRAEIIGALVNSSTLVVLSIYLVYEAIQRALNPSPFQGWAVIGIAGVALIIDVLTAMLTYRGAKESVNIRAAFIHNLTDALTSVVVMVSGIAAVVFDIYWLDWLATILISAFVIQHALAIVKQSMQILMQGAPSHLSVPEIKARVESLEGVREAHHIHIWQLDDRRIFFEAHVVIEDVALSEIESIKKRVRECLREEFKISHSTIEVEVGSNCGHSH